MRTSELANIGVSVMLKFTGINADVLTISGTAADVAVPCVTVTMPAPPGSAGTIATICPSLHPLTLAAKVFDPTVMVTVPGVVPNPVPAIDTVAPGFATRGVTLPIEGGLAAAEAQIETLRCGKVKLSTA
jgi:hypothetical protein